MPLRAAAICGLLASVTFVAGLLFGDLAQPDAFSPANDNISDIGAQTADHAWIYNQIAGNLNGLLILAFALGLWRALGSGWLASLGVLGLAVLGLTRFLEGFLRLDCGGIDEGCENTSWQADAHRIESGIAAALFFLVPPVLAFAFRRLPQWRDLWLPTLLDRAGRGGREHSLQRHRRRRGGTRCEHHLVPLARAPSVAADAARGRENGQTGLRGGGLAALKLQSCLSPNLGGPQPKSIGTRKPRPTATRPSPA